jgi:hypothetical protein
MLTAAWEDGEESRLTVGGVFCLKTDKEGLASTSLCPIFTWDRDSWCVFPLLSGHNKEVTWLTPAFHRTVDAKGELESFHVGPYFEGKNYWMVPPLLSWHWEYEDKVSALWLTPLFHTTWNKDGNAESSHLFPVYFWERDDYWAAPPLLSMGWANEHGDRTIWATPFFHRTVDSDGMLLSMHLGPYLQGRDYWGVPPLLSGSWQYGNGERTTWLTPLFHVTARPDGEIDSLHVGPYLQGRNYWAVPPLLSWHVRYADQTETTWLTPAFHVTADPQGLESLHVLPAFFWDRDDYWFAPPILTGGWRRRDGGQTTWITPLFHDTIDGQGDLRSLHLAPVWCWERDNYWAIPPLMIGGGSHDDGAQTTWITPLFHYTEDRRGEAESFHVLPAVFWKRDDYWLAPFLLSGGFTRPDGSSRTWISPFYHDDYAADGTLRSRHALNYFQGPDYDHIVPVFWDWKGQDRVHHTLFAPAPVRADGRAGRQRDDLASVAAHHRAERRRARPFARAGAPPLPLPGRGRALRGQRPVAAVLGPQRRGSDARDGRPALSLDAAEQARRDDEGSRSWAVSSPATATTKPSATATGSSGSSPSAAAA